MEALKNLQGLMGDFFQRYGEIQKRRRACNDVRVASHSGVPADRGQYAAGSQVSPEGPRRNRKNRGKKRNALSGSKSKMKRHTVPDFAQVLEQAKENAGDTVEKGTRAKLLDSFLRASHGDLETFGKIHREALENDPIFYGHIARWYFENGSIRDHNELFVSHLLTSPFEDHRENGTVLMQYLRPYQVANIVRYSKEVLNYTTRALKAAVTKYLRRREENPLWFDEHVIRRRDALKYLYATLHIKPCDRAEKILFEENPPSDSRVYIAKQLEKLAGSPDEQARLILQHKLHYTAAIGAIKHFTPGILYALASVMTPQQVINNLSFFEKRGALSDPDTKMVIAQRLKYGQKESRVSDFKSLVALSRINADANLAKELMDITGARIRERGAIKVPTALFIDKSGSMQQCIDVGKLLATMCSTITRSKLYVYAFDTTAFEIKAKGTEFADWDRAFAPIKANNATSIGAPFHPLMDVEIDQVVIISDGEENAPPKFKDMLKKYEAKNNKRVKVIFIKVDRKFKTPLEHDMEGEDFTVINFDGDYYNLPNVIPILAAGNNFELVEEVLSMPLYTLEKLADLPEQFDEKTFEVLI